MKLYENRKEVKLWDALFDMLSDEWPGHDFEYMISFDDNTRLIAFGKTWVSGASKLWIHEQYCPTFPYDDRDVFLLELFKNLNTYFGQKRLHVWEEV